MYLQNVSHILRYCKWLLALTINLIFNIGADAGICNLWTRPKFQSTLAHKLLMTKQKIIEVSGIMSHFEAPGQCADYPFFLFSDTWPKGSRHTNKFLEKNKKSCSITGKPWGCKDYFFLFVCQFMTQLNHGENDMLWNGLSWL